MRYNLNTSASFEGHKYIIGNKYYIFRTILISPNSTVALTKTAIKELVISDNIFNFYLDGYMILDNTEDALERLSPLPQDIEIAGNDIKQMGYTMRGDGRDILYITVIPLLDGSTDFNTSSQDFNKLFGLNYYFVLSNETNIVDGDKKYKKYDIVDVDYQVLKENKSFFTTKGVNTKNESSLTDDERSEYTGSAMKRILTNILGENAIKIENNTTPNFETGISKIFFSSPSDMSAYDVLEYLQGYHVSDSSGLDSSFIKKDSFTGEFTLNSFSSLYKKAYIGKDGIDAGGTEFIENFTITGAQDSTQIKVNESKKPNIALELGDLSDVIDVKFYNISAEQYTSKVRSRIVHSYDVKDKSFNIDMVEGDIENVKTDFTTLYTTPLKGKNKKPFPSFINNNTKKTNKTFDNVFNVYNNFSSDIAMGRNKLLFNSIILNMGVEITIKGSFSRSGGKFFSLDRKGDYVDNIFDNKFLGIYFIINVEHAFKDGEFYDTIIAVKTYHFTDPKITEDIS